MTAARGAVRRTEEMVDPRDRIVSFLRRSRWVIASCVVFAVAFGVVASMMPRVYRTSTVLAPAISERAGRTARDASLGQLGGLAMLVTLPSSSSGMEEALAVLRSREFTERFIEENGLMQVIFSSKWNPARATWKGEESDAPSLADAYRYFDRNVRTIIFDGDTGLVTIRIEWKDREQAAAWANELVQRINGEMRARAIAKSNASVAYLERELASTAVVGVRDAISRLMEEQIRQRMLANVTQEYVFRVVDVALPPDPEDFVRPRTLFMTMVGFSVGFVVAVYYVLTLPSTGGNRRAAAPGMSASEA
jgi:uncharacterized protein involved in exopolysaccharide biosynthesis